MSFSSVSHAAWLTLIIPQSIVFNGIIVVKLQLFPHNTAYVIRLVSNGHVHTAILSLFLCMICLYWERCVKNDTPLNRTPVQSDEWKMAFYAALSHLMRIGESNGNAWINDDDNDVDGLFPTSTWRLKTFREPRSQYDSLSYRTVTELLNTQMTAWKGFVSMAFVRLILLFVSFRVYNSMKIS